MWSATVSAGPVASGAQAAGLRNYCDVSECSNVLRLGFATAALRPIPKGLRLPAQGWRETPTLGACSEMETTPTALWRRSGARAETEGLQPRREDVHQKMSRRIMAFCINQM